MKFKILNNRIKVKNKIKMMKGKIIMTGFLMILWKRMFLKVKRSNKIVIKFYKVRSKMRSVTVIIWMK